MEQWDSFVKKLVEGLGFRSFRVEINEEFRHGAVFIDDIEPLSKDGVAHLVEDINHILQLIAKKNSVSPFFFDINNYRREREVLITELARAAAQKVLATKAELSLPPMNSYERRLVHTALAHHPDVATESLGIGRDRYVVIRPISAVSGKETASVSAS